MGDRIFIDDRKHPWVDHSGEVISGLETYGLGWHGYRVELDGNCGETYVMPEQVFRLTR